MPRGISRANERRAARPPIIDPDQLYDVHETAAARGRSVSATWADIRAGKIQSVMASGRRLVLGAEIIRANRAEAGIEVTS